MRILQRLAATISYVTCMPLWRAKSSEELEGLAKYLHLAGVLIGACLLTVNTALGLVHAKHFLSGSILAVTWLLLTNGIHFDGLMDTADGIFSHQSRERMLEIMQDPRVGNFGVLTGVSVLLLKVAALTSIRVPDIMLVLILVPAWARWAETVAICGFPYIKESGKGKIWHDTSRYPRDILLAGLAPSLMVAAACALGYWQAPLISLFTALSGLCAVFWLNHKLGGHTGDTYGCTVEIAEAGGLTFTALALSSGLLSSFS
jgi:adenosylcobinamide-GDP ribazoletransferase